MYIFSVNVASTPVNSPTAMASWNDCSPNLMLLRSVSVSVPEILASPLFTFRVPEDTVMSPFVTVSPFCIVADPLERIDENDPDPAFKEPPIDADPDVLNAPEVIPPEMVALPEFIFKSPPVTVMEFLTRRAPPIFAPELDTSRA